MIGRIDRVGAFTPGTGPQSLDAAPGFGEALDALLKPRPPPSVGGTGEGGVTFSRHAQNRLQSRGIELDESDLEDLSKAVDQLQRKGARESLVLLGDNAFIVGVPDRKVVTAMSRQEAVGNIFTNIDSTVVAR